MLLSLHQLVDAVDLTRLAALLNSLSCCSRGASVSCWPLCCKLDVRELCRFAGSVKPMIVLGTNIQCATSTKDDLQCP
jgi:hypothetical protein